MTWTTVVAGGVVGAVAIWRMLAAAAAQGGGRSGDAARDLGQIISQNDAFRGARPSEPWDGVERPKGMLGNTDGF